MRQALIVGINDYPRGLELDGCVNDANEVARLLRTNEDGTKNFDVQIKENIPTRAELRKNVRNLFNSDADVALFYFSGHGSFDESGGCLVTPDACADDVGVSMDEILNFANESDIKTKIVILDCCYSGAFGVPANLNGASQLRKGVTILSASRENESAVEVGGQGIFTKLLLDALEGGAADLKGDVTPGSIYAHIDSAIGNWGQRPVFKTNVTRFTPLRKVNPAIPILTLRELVALFPNPEEEFPLNKTYEWTNEDVAIEENVAIFKVLQKMNRVGLIVPTIGNDMYWAAQKDEGCKLTVLGKYYWKLVKDGKI